MTRQRRGTPTAVELALYRWCLRAFPRDFREEAGIEMAQAFVDRREARRLRGVRAWRDTALECLDLVVTGSGMRWKARNTRNGRGRWAGRHMGRWEDGMGVWVSGLSATVRQLARRPLWLALVMGILGLGIGAGTAVFSVVDAVAVRELPYQDPASLLRVGATRMGRPGVGAMSGPDFRRMESSVTRLSSVAASTPGSMALGNETGPADQVRGGYVSGAFFETLGRNALMGRTLTPADDQPGAAPVVVLSHTLWASLFNRGDVLGRALDLDGREATVVGVMGPDFHPPEGAHLARTLLWAPLAGAPLPLDEAGLSFLDVVGRMAPGATPEQVTAELDALARGIAEAEGRPERSFSGFVTASLTEETVGDTWATLSLLVGAAALLLLIAAANVAHLMLVRAGDRASEMAVRVSLGAGRTRIVAESVGESLILALAGGALGAAVAHLSVEGLTRWAPVDLPRLQEVTVDARVLGFAVGLSVVVGLAVGLTQAVRVLRGDALDGIVRALRGETEGRRSGHVRDGLVVAQAGLGLVLLTGAGLLMNSLVRLHHVDPGLEPDGLHFLSLTLGQEAGAGPGADASVQRALLDAMAAVPGVRDASLTTGAPFGNGGWSVYVDPEGLELPEEELWATRIGLHQVSADHLANLGARMVSGREIVASDVDSGEPVVVISSTLARRYWPDTDPVGRRLVVGGDGTFTSRTIVGVVDAPLYGGPQSSGEAHLYLPFTDFPATDVEVALRLDALDPAAVSALRQAVHRVDPGASVRRLVPAGEAMSRYFVEPGFYAWLLTGYGTIALLLAAVGLYGTLAFSVVRQRRALGIRMALGADAGRLVAQVVRRGLALTGLGLVVGLGAAIALARGLQGFVFGISTTDPLTYAVACAVLMGAGLLASWLPAQQAGRTEPVESLRAE